MKLTMVVPDVPAVLNQALEGLVRVNAAMLIAGLLVGRPVPPLYRSPLRYKQEPPGREWWQTVADNQAVPHADCEDLASHKTGELRVAPLVLLSIRLGDVKSALAAIGGGDFHDGIDAVIAGDLYPARAFCKRTGKRTYHALVEHPDGRIEDPSIALGMKRRRRP